MLAIRTDPRTQAAITAIRAASPEATEAGVLTACVAAVLGAFENGGPIDSHLLADEFVERRMRAGKSVSWDQCRDYVQHLLRETAHVCRHAEGHHYSVHADRLCNATCDQKRSIATAAVRRPASVCCFLETLHNGLCPNGCDAD